MPTKAQPGRSLRLGLTGGMGCGKSTAAGIFRELDFGVVDADAVVRDLLTRDPEVLDAVRARWGGRVREDGEMRNAECGMRNEEATQADAARSALHTPHSAFPLPHSALRAPHSAFPVSRRKIAEIVFTAPAELAWLEELLHPRVRAAWQAEIAAHPSRDWVVEIPLLFEKSLASLFDFTLCVWAHPAIQARRLAARGLSPAESAARQARQWPLEDKAARADFVLDNDGGAGFLRRQIERLARQLRTPNP